MNTATATPSVLTHNGTITIKSVATGQHRTFRIRTQPADATFAPGERVLALLSGPDNTSDYQPFAFVQDYGVCVWRSKRGGQFDKMARMLERLAEHEAAGHIEVRFATRCRRCNRPLTTPTSIDEGIGPKCALSE